MYLLCEFGKRLQQKSKMKLIQSWQSLQKLAKEECIAHYFLLSIGECKEKLSVFELFKVPCLQGPDDASVLREVIQINMN